MEQTKQKILYILELEDDCWYVGTSTNFSRRFQQHIDGEGSAWTKFHKPIKIERTMECTSVFMEDNMTKTLMMEFGIDKVRGGSYCQVELREDQILNLKREFATAQDHCIICLQEKHPGKACTQKPKRRICERCGRNTHFVKNCYAKKHLDGTILLDTAPVKPPQRTHTNQNLNGNPSHSNVRTSGIQKPKQTPIESDSESSDYEPKLYQQSNLPPTYHPGPALPRPTFETTSSSNKSCTLV